MEFPTSETARSQEGRALGANKEFWARTDLIFIGDLSWTGQLEPEGFEYITPPVRSANKFEYSYGMIMISGKQVVNELICEIEGPMDESKTFKMKIQGEWLDGPLKAWIDTMPLDLQNTAKERYKKLISWIYTQV